MELTEKCLERKEIYHGRILTVHVDRVLLPDGKEGIREIADHPGGVTVVAIDDDDNLLTVRQYRYAFSRVIEELPAGKLERGEDPQAAALRELREETGAVPDNLTSLGSLIASPGCYGERLWLYYAEGLHFGETSFDEDEFLTVQRTPFSVMLDRVMRGEVEDAKTVCGILKVDALRRQKR